MEGEKGIQVKRGRAKAKVCHPLDIFRFLLSLRVRQKKHPCVLEFRRQHVCLVLQGSDRCTVTASPQNTAHPQVGLINLARHC